MIIPTNSDLKLPKRFCPKCGRARIYPGSYCGYCGHRIVEEEGNIIDQLLFGVEYDAETGTVIIFPLNDERSIVLQGEDQVDRFTEYLKDLFR